MWCGSPRVRHSRMAHPARSDAQRAHPSNHVEGFVLLLHFFVNRINMFWTPADLGFDIILFQQFYKIFFYGFKLGFAVWPFFGEQFCDLFIFFRVDIAKAKVFEFPFDLPDARGGWQAGQKYPVFPGQCVCVCAQACD